MRMILNRRPPQTWTRIVAGYSPTRRPKPPVEAPTAGADHDGVPEKSTTVDLGGLLLARGDWTL